MQVIFKVSCRFHYTTHLILNKSNVMFDHIISLNLYKTKTTNRRKSSYSTLTIYWQDINAIYIYTVRLLRHKGVKYIL